MGQLSKRILSISLIVVMMINSCIPLIEGVSKVYAEDMSEIQQIIDKENESLKTYYGIMDWSGFGTITQVGKEYNINTKGVFGELSTRLDKYRTDGQKSALFVYGDPIVYKSNDIKNGVYRYLGRTVFGSDYTNMGFQDDATGLKYEAVSRDGNKTNSTDYWIKQPWYDPTGKGLSANAITNTTFNMLVNRMPQDAYNNLNQSIITGMKVQNAMALEDIKNGVKGVEPYIADEKKLDSITDWPSYAYILQLNTWKSWGMARLFHNQYNQTTKTWKIWYTTVPIAPLSMIPKDKLAIISNLFMDDSSVSSQVIVSNSESPTDIFGLLAGEMRNYKGEVLSEVEEERENEGLKGILINLYGVILKDINKAKVEGEKAFNTLVGINSESIQKALDNYLTLEIAVEENYDSVKEYMEKAGKNIEDERHGVARQLFIAAI